MHGLAGFGPRASNARVVRVDPGVHGEDPARFQDAVDLSEDRSSVVGKINDSAGKSVCDAVGWNILDALVWAFLS